LGFLALASSVGQRRGLPTSRRAAQRLIHSVCQNKSAIFKHPICPCYRRLMGLYYGFVLKPEHIRSIGLLRALPGLYYRRHDCASS
jgi:hypothetical protein